MSEVDGKGHGTARNDQESVLIHLCFIICGRPFMIHGLTMNFYLKKLKAVVIVYMLIWIWSQEPHGILNMTDCDLELPSTSRMALVHRI